MHWEINKCVGLDLLQYLLYHCGLELNLEYLWRLPVLCCFAVLFQLWLLRVLWDWLLCPYDKAQLLYFLIICLLSGTLIVPESTLNTLSLPCIFSVPALKSAASPRCPGSCYWTMLESSAWPLVCILLPAVTASKPLQWMEPWNSHM